MGVGDGRRLSALEIMDAHATTHWTDDDVYAAEIEALYAAYRASEQALVDATVAAMTARCRAAMRSHPQLRSVAFGLRSNAYDDCGPEECLSVVEVVAAAPERTFSSEDTRGFDLAVIADERGRPLEDVQQAVRAVQSALSVLDVELVAQIAGYPEIAIRISQEGVTFIPWVDWWE